MKKRYSRDAVFLLIGRLAHLTQFFQSPASQDWCKEKDPPEERASEHIPKQDKETYAMNEKTKFAEATDVVLSPASLLR